MPDFEKDSAGLLPVIAQDKNTGTVLMLAYANKEAFMETLKTGYAVFYSRSRAKLWRKGETSGNTMRVEDVFVDCDGDAILYSVVPSGPACHTGNPTCFFRSVTA